MTLSPIWCRAEEAGYRVTTMELPADVNLLFAAGQEATVNLIGNGLYSLCDGFPTCGCWIQRTLNDVPASSREGFRNCLWRREMLSVCV